MRRNVLSILVFVPLVLSLFHASPAQSCKKSIMARTRVKNDRRNFRQDNTPGNTVTSWVSHTLGGKTGYGYSRSDDVSLDCSHADCVRSHSGGKKLDAEAHSWCWLDVCSNTNSAGDPEIDCASFPAFITQMRFNLAINDSSDIASIVGSEAVHGDTLRQSFHPGSFLQIYIRDALANEMNRAVIRLVAVSDGIVVDSGSIALVCLGNDGAGVTLARTGCFAAVGTSVTNTAPGFYVASLENLDIEIPGVTDPDLDGVELTCLSMPPLGDTNAASTINSSAGPGGSVGPGTVIVDQGSSQTFTINADSCYRIADVKVDGASVGAIPSYAFVNVQSDHEISASFAENCVAAVPRAPSLADGMRASPNPFHGATSLNFVLAEARNIKVAVYDAAGRQVRVLYSGLLGIGEHHLFWDGRDSQGRGSEAGSYLIRLESSGMGLSTRVVELR
jgi:hypothetical protein